MTGSDKEKKGASATLQLKLQTHTHTHTPTPQDDPTDANLDSSVSVGRSVQRDPARRPPLRPLPPDRRHRDPDLRVSAGLTVRPLVPRSGGREHQRHLPVPSPDHPVGPDYPLHGRGRRAFQGRPAGPQSVHAARRGRDGARRRDLLVRFRSATREREAGRAVEARSSAPTRSNSSTSAPGDKPTLTGRPKMPLSQKQQKGCSTMVLWPLAGVLLGLGVALIATVFYFSRETTQKVQASVCQETVT